MDDLLKFLKELKDNASLAGLVVLLGALTALFTFYNEVAIPMYNKTVKPIVDLFGAVVSSPRRLQSLEAKLDAVLTELKPNSGSSIKDQLTRLEGKVLLGEAQRLLLLNSNAHGIWVSDSSGYCTWVNDTLKRKVNARSVEDLQGQNWINCIHPADRKFVADEWEDAVKDGRSFDLHYRMIDMKTQTPFGVHGLASPALDWHGNVIGFNGVIYFLDNASQ